MSKRLSILAALALLASACSKPETPSTAPAADGAPAADAAAAASGAPPAPAPAAGPRALTSAELSEPRTQTLGSCNVESVGKQAFGADPLVVTRGPITLTGWFLSEASHATGVPASLRLIAEDRSSGWDVPLAHWSPRPDVTESMKAVDKGDAGFAEDVDTSHFAAGNYRVTVNFLQAGTLYGCDHNRVISVQ